MMFQVKKKWFDEDMRTSSELNLILVKKNLLLLHIFASAQKPILLTLMFGLYQDRFLCELTRCLTKKTEQTVFGMDVSL